MLFVNTNGPMLLSFLITIGHIVCKVLQESLITAEVQLGDKKS